MPVSMRRSASCRAGRNCSITCTPFMELELQLLAGREAPANPAGRMGGERILVGPDAGAFLHQYDCRALPPGRGGDDLWLPGRDRVERAVCLALAGRAGRRARLLFDGL